jgi:outer membrane protein assembly factor BamB
VQYLEAGSLAGAPKAGMRVYQPVSRSFVGTLVASEQNPVLQSGTFRLGVGAQAGRQELAVELDQSAGEPVVKVTLTDRASLAASAVGVSVASELIRTVGTDGTPPAFWNSAVGRYMLSAPPANTPDADQNAQIAVQVLPTGRVLWQSRLTGYSGTGAASLTALSGALINAPLYESRAASAGTLVATSALLGELQWKRALGGGWEIGLESNRLEQPRSKVKGSRGSTGFVGEYSPVDFAAGTHYAGIRKISFDEAGTLRIPGNLLGALLGADLPAMTLVSQDPLAGGSLGYTWSVTVSNTGAVRATGVASGGVTPPSLSLRLDRVRGEWSGAYTAGGVRRLLIGCVVDLPESRGRGWFESSGSSGRFELKLGQ